ncbi:uridine phosphorylase [bacterium]|nr:uridine phosphorylase [bacterium]
MKLYGEYNKKDWLESLKLSEEDVPDTLILHGEQTNDVLEKLDDWAVALKSKKRLRWNIILGEYNGKKIAYAIVTLAPDAASIAYIFGMLGTKRFIQTGYCGGLSKQIEYGEILLGKSVESEDGISQFYYPDSKTFESSVSLIDSAKHICEERDWNLIEGSIVSTSIMLLETKEMIKQWHSRGFLGVDGESASTFAVAKRFGAECISLLNVSDHLLKGDTVFSYSSDREQLEERIDSQISTLALNLACLDLNN